MRQYIGAIGRMFQAAEPPGPKKDMVEMIRAELGIYERPDGSLGIGEGPYTTTLWMLENSERIAELGKAWREQNQ